MENKFYIYATCYKRRVDIFFSFWIVIKYFLATGPNYVQHLLYVNFGIILFYLLEQLTGVALLYYLALENNDTFV